MKLDLDRKDLESLVKGISLKYTEFNNKLVIKAGHSYSYSCGRTDWYKLSNLSDEELVELYKICKNSWN